MSDVKFPGPAERATGQPAPRLPLPDLGHPLVLPRGYAVEVTPSLLEKISSGEMHARLAEFAKSLPEATWDHIDPWPPEWDAKL